MRVSRPRSSSTTRIFALFIASPFLPVGDRPRQGTDAVRKQEKEASHAFGQGAPFLCCSAQKLSLFLFHLDVDSPGPVYLCQQRTDRGFPVPEASLRLP